MAKSTIIINKLDNVAVALCDLKRAKSTRG